MADAALLRELPLFMLAVLVLNATPGADLLLMTVSRTLQCGWPARVSMDNEVRLRGRAHGLRRIRPALDRPQRK